MFDQEYQYFYETIEPKPMETEEEEMNDINRKLSILLSNQEYYEIEMIRRLLDVFTDPSKENRKGWIPDIIRFIVMMDEKYLFNVYHFSKPVVYK